MIMEYVYPAVFHTNRDNSYTITYPDLPGCVSEGKSLENAIFMAQSALSQWIGYLSDEKQELPTASSIKSIDTSGEEFVSLIRIETKEDRAIKRTVSIPKWMDDRVVESGLSLSRVLQDALSQRFQ